jgi:hypothetical protein
VQRENHLGLAAGTVVAAALGWVLFASQWRMFALRPDGPVPVAPVDADPTTVFVCVAVVGAVSAVAGFVYPYYAGGAGGQWADLARTILFVPAGALVAAGAGTLLLATLQDLSAGVARALVAGVVTLVVAVALSAVVALAGAALFVPPAVIGVYAGVRAARLAGAEDPAVFEDVGGRDAPWSGDADDGSTGGAGVGSTGGARDGAATGRRGRVAALVPSFDDGSPQRFGWWAGVAGTALVATMLVVGPWAPYAVTPAGALPVTERPGGGTPFVPAVAALAVAAGYAAAARYEAAVDAPADGWRRAMAWQAALAPMVVALAVAVVFLTGHALSRLPGGVAPVELPLRVVGAALGATVSGTAAGFAASVVVGVPAAAGVYLRAVVP